MIVTVLNSEALRADLREGILHPRPDTLRLDSVFRVCIRFTQSEHPQMSSDLQRGLGLKHN